MKHSYFQTGGVWLKGNLHSHTTVSDGVYEPAEMAMEYRAHGYDFISMTDHNVFVAHQVPQAEGLLLLPGVEHDLAYSGTNCIHVVGTGSAGKMETGYVCRKFTPSEMSDQELVDRMREDGQYVVLAHPAWSRMEPEEVAALKGFHAIEVYNRGAENLCHAGRGDFYWDMLLRRGRKVFGMASDDTHKKWDAFGGWIWVKAREKSHEAIMEALFAGQFYGSAGPQILDFGLDGDQAYVSCSGCREIHFVTWPPRGASRFASEGGVLTEETYPLKGTERYLRLECVDHAGRIAWTNPIFFDERA